MLQKAGGLFQLLAELDFGTAFGVKSIYYKSRATNPASAGQIRLGNTEVVSWRNAANSANIDLTVNASNRLAFGTITVPTISSSDTLTNKTMSGSSNTFSSIAYASLVLTNSIVNADISSSAAIAYSKLNLSGSIVNADINASAAIAFSKLAALSSANLLIGNVSNVATSVAMSGDTTISNAGVVAIGSNKVTNAMLAQVSTAIFKGRTTAGTGNVEDLTATQATALLNNFVGDSGSGGTKGLVIAPAAGDAAAQKFLKADGTWSAVSGSALLPQVFGTTASPRSISAASGIAAAGSNMSTTASKQLIFLKGASAGLNTIIATPQIQAGTAVGQEMQLSGESSTDYILLSNGNGLALYGEWFSYDPTSGNNVLILYWDGSVWAEKGRGF